MNHPNTEQMDSKPGAGGGAHAPAPWHVESYRTGGGLREPPDGKIVADAYGNAIADLPRMFFGNQSALNDNARLIAAAPETAAERDKLKASNASLLDALQNLVYGIEHPTSGVYEKAMPAARDAIALAQE